MSINPTEYLGVETLEKMKRTKWYALARMLEDMLYNGRVAPDPDRHNDPRFITPEKAYVGEKTVQPWVKIMGHEGAYIDVQKGLRELVHECERMAIKEVT